MANSSSRNNGFPPVAATNANLSEQISAGRFRQARAKLVGERATDDSVEKARRLGIGERPKHNDDTPFGADTPARCFEQLRSGQADQQNGRVDGRERVDEAEKGRLGPLQVVQKKDDRPVSGEPAKEPPGCPCDLLG